MQKSPLFFSNSKGGGSILVALLLFLVFLTVAGFITWNTGSNQGDVVGDGFLYAKDGAVKDLLLVNNTGAGFENPTRECDIVEVRVEGSEDYVQQSVDYYAYEHGQGEHGDINALIEIYNCPNDYANFVVEVSRLAWCEMTVSYNGTVICVFPEVSENDVMKLGYITFEVPCP